MRRNLEVKLATGKYIGEFHTGNSAQAKDFNILNMNVSRETLYGNINHRFLQMIDSGAVEEVQNLLKLKYNPALPVMKAVGVSEIAAYLESQSRQPGASAGVSERELTRSETINNVSRETMIQKAQQRSRNYAKRQMTWFRHQLPKHKIDVASFEEAINLIK